MNQTRYCSTCGSLLSEEAALCGECGARYQPSPYARRATDAPGAWSQAPRPRSRGRGTEARPVETVAAIELISQDSLDSMDSLDRREQQTPAPRPVEQYDRMMVTQPPLTQNGPGAPFGQSSGPGSPGAAPDPTTPGTVTGAEMEPPLDGCVPSSPVKRLVAALIDGVIVMVLLIPMIVAIVLLAVQDPITLFTQILSGISVVIPVAYTLLVIWLTGAKGFSFGKLIMGLRIARTHDGKGIGFLRAAGRWVLYSIIPWLMGLSIFLDPRSLLRGFHDRAVDSVVVDVKSGRNPFVKRADDYERADADHYLGDPSVAVSAHENLLAEPGEAWTGGHHDVAADAQHSDVQHFDVQPSGGWGGPPSSGASPVPSSSSSAAPSSSSSPVPSSGGSPFAASAGPAPSPAAAPMTNVPVGQPSAGAADADAAQVGRGPDQGQAAATPENTWAPPRDESADQQQWGPPAPQQEQQWGPPAPPAPQPEQQWGLPAPPASQPEQPWGPPTPQTQTQTQTQTQAEGGAPELDQDHAESQLASPQWDQPQHTASPAQQSLAAPFWDAPREDPSEAPNGPSGAAGGPQDHDVDEQPRLIPSEESPEDLEQTRITAVPPPAVKKLRLTVDDGTELLVEKAAVIGRNPSAADGAEQLVLKDGTRSVSKTHLRIDDSGEDITVTDLGSTNGSTIVHEDGSRVALLPDAATILPLGAQLTLGDRALSVEREL
ncbi:RDD family protein [Brachybacterium tyrofermentans]|uniref:RDD family protein n=1 Tax=Brachybacterium tyrofermentans TaxID=47848 RepID=UPI003FD41C84